MNDNNVIVFPGNKKNHPPQTIADIQNDVKQVRMAKAEDIVTSCMLAVVDALAIHNITLDDISERKNNTWLLEAIRNTVYSKLDLEYPLQDIVNQLYKEEQHPEAPEIVIVTWDYDHLKVEKPNE